MLNDVGVLFLDLAIQAVEGSALGRVMGLGLPLADMLPHLVWFRV